MEILTSQKILVIQTAFIGDAILTLPMIQMLHKRAPQSQIDVLCIPGTEEIFKASPFVNHVIVYDKRGKDKSLIKLFSISKHLKKQNYSIIYSPHRSLRTAIITMFTGVKNSVAFSNSALKEFYGTLVKYQNKDHEVKRNLALIGYQDDDWRILPEISTDEQRMCKVGELLSEGSNQKYAALAPGSVWETKKYPVDYYIKIAAHLINRNYKIILLGGKGDVDSCSRINEIFPEHTILAAPRFSIVESIEILRRCSVLICNDSAPTHMGMAANIPVVTIYCSTVPDFGFYPYNDKSTWITYNDLDCKPCGIHGHARCPIGTFECAHKISINKILQEIDRII